MYINFPDIDRVIWHIAGPFAISWYSMSYVLGIILGYLYTGYLTQNYRLKISRKQQEYFLNYLLIVIVFARLGYVVVYDFAYYIQHPMQILKIYEGGLSFHGAFIGVLVAAFIFAYKEKVSMLNITDLIAVAGPITIFFARIANFINCELQGRITNVPWAVLFPPEYLPRHPSQIYESLSEGFLIFLILNILIARYRIIEKPGITTGSFLILYSFARFTCEFFREPDITIGFIADYFTMGQILCLPTLFVGILCLLKK